MAEKVHQEKLHGVQARLSFEGSSRKNSQTQEKSQYSELESFDRKKKSKKRRRPSPNTMSRSSHPFQSVFSRLKHGDSEPSCRRNPANTDVFTRLGEKERSVFIRLGNKERIARDPDRRKREAKSLNQSYVNCSSERQREIKQEWNAVDRANRKMLIPAREATLSESKNSRGGHWKSRPKKLKSSTDEDDLSQPWLCEEMDPFTPRIRNFVFPKRIHMPSNVRIYDGTGDPEDHLKNFQTAAKVERWAMPTWCHMFNSTQMGAARLWFDELPLESIDSFMEIQKAFLANLLQQKKYIKDLIEIHHIKQKEGESNEAFM
ncbi:hypothetical protein Tco_0859929 [Tanacetum coccineum]|uniref:Reverse transcriptase domain-containing protein n=1 Tax=Tanacetum coccineum TaxID=301880 RepID=A0ABQ5BFQ0_9ASTR